jgi:hypothetical protein
MPNFGMSQKKLVAKISKIDPKLVPIINKNGNERWATRLDHRKSSMADGPW